MLVQVAVITADRHLPAPFWRSLDLEYEPLRIALAQPLQIVREVPHRSFPTGAIRLRCIQVAAVKALADIDDAAHEIQMLLLQAEDL